MDQDAFRRTYRDVNERFCAFEKGILTHQCSCSQAERFCIAEREGVHCRSAAGQAQCLELLDLLRREARFALRTDPEQDRRTLPHGKAIRVQIGGLRGIRALLDGRDGTAAEQASAPAITDVYATLNEACEAYGGFDRLPFSRIMPHIAAYRGRTRSRRRRDRR